MRSRTLIIGVLATSFALALGGCGGDDSGDGGESSSSPAESEVPTLQGTVFEQNITSGSSSGTDPIVNASCPSEVPAEAGSKFECDIETQSGDTGTAAVTLKSADGSDYEIRYTYD